MDIVNTQERVSIVQNWFDRDWEIDLPAVQDSVWKARDGTLGVILVNTVKKKIVYGYKLNMKNYGYRDDMIYKVRSLDDRDSEESMYTNFVFERVDTLPPLGVVILEIKGMKDTEPGQ